MPLIDPYSERGVRKVHGLYPVAGLSLLTNTSKGSDYHKLIQANIDQAPFKIEIRDEAYGGLNNEMELEDDVAIVCDSIFYERRDEFWKWSDSLKKDTK